MRGRALQSRRSISTTPTPAASAWPSACSRSCPISCATGWRRLQACAVRVRLSVLRRSRQRGGPPRQGDGGPSPARARPPEPAMPQRSTSSAASSGASRPRGRRARPPEPVERVVGRRAAATRATGSVVVVRREYPLDAPRTARRRSATRWTRRSTLLAQLLARTSDARRPPTGLLFLDTETTGLAGGTGTYAFLVGVRASSRASGSWSTQYFMRDFDEEPALLAALEPLLDAGRGRRDVQRERASTCRCWRRASCSPAGAGRRRCRTSTCCARPGACGPAVLADCRLPTLERGVLGLVREDDVPGRDDPARSTSTTCARAGRRRCGACSRTTAHDVLSLVALLGWFGARARRGRRRSARGAGGPRPALGAGGCSSAALGLLPGRARGGLAEPVARWARLRLAWWEKRRARWEAACALWEAAARPRGLRSASVGGAGQVPRASRAATWPPPATLVRGRARPGPRRRRRLPRCSRPSPIVSSELDRRSRATRQAAD